MKFKLLIKKVKWFKNKKMNFFLAFKVPEAVFIMLINVKMITINCWYFNIDEHTKF